jgi:hypothetical protein
MNKLSFFSAACLTGHAAAITGALLLLLSLPLPLLSLLA